MFYDLEQVAKEQQEALKRLIDAELAESGKEAA